MLFRSPNSGECEDDGAHGDGMPCPPATFAAAVGTCDQYPPDGEIFPPDPCLVNKYFDRQLGFCVPLQDDCCPIGQDYSPLTGECEDVVTKPRDGECPNGFELIDGLCWLIGRTEGKGGACWTITRRTPKCVGPCEVGLIYNEITGRCEEPPEPEDPCKNVNCSSYSSNNCPSNCCKLKNDATGYPQCVKK